MQRDHLSLHYEHLQLSWGSNRLFNIILARMTREEQLAEKYKILEKRRCKCGRFDCNRDHAVCQRCGKENHVDAIPGACDSGGVVVGRHTYAF